VSQKEFSLSNLGMPHARESKGAIMAKVIIGNQSAVTVPRQDRDSIRRFYCDVLGGKIVKEGNEKDILRLQEEFYIVFRYGDVPDESEFLRSSRSIWLQIQSDNVQEMTRKILDFGVRKLDIPAPPPLFSGARGAMLPADRNQRGPLIF
jgi:catechol 2,3-dioxygenase-like lactoylglutathione lyase family enzyme